ncbi:MULTISPECIES: diacylglycerol kinase family protein [Streptomyces]|uniref:Phosphoesterase PA-phosphatase related protein n=1 Tax=Streptomyces alboflavus TaxID=67267 RepID=A0A1Z1WLY1_9ACTN|nr:diacylglycerol kinase family protein [Streptomyces alboflavus]ARX87441.1 phosphoesterase PA-phosphatase related protein [Streptomyces alboflavus]
MRTHEPRLGERTTLASSAAKVLIGNRSARRAALRGTGSLVLACAAIQAATKVLDKRRPLRHPPKEVVSSQRTAGAAAFATGATLETPRLGAVLLPVAVGIAVSRLRAGAHAPGRVLVDVAFGVGIAAATCRWWPLHRDKPADSAGPKLPVPALPSGEGLVVVVNSDAGGEVPSEVELRTLLPKADVRLCDAGEDLHTVLRQAAAQVQARGGALGVVGGDGTANAAAVLAADNHLPLAVFPGGTLNHFAADLGLPTLQEAADAVEAGRGGTVDLGRITGDGTCTYFLNTFSIGVYPELVRAREARETSLGKWPALAVGLLRVLADGAPIDVTLDGQPRRLWLLFAGNSRYDPPGFAPSYRPTLDDGLLDLRIVDGKHPFARTRLVAAFLTGTLARSRVYRETTATRLRIDGMDKAGDYTRDGEVSPAADTLVLDKRSRALTVYLPAPP